METRELSLWAPAVGIHRLGWMYCTIAFLAQYDGCDKHTVSTYISKAENE